MSDKGHLPRPHSAKHKMTDPWMTSSTAVAAGLPGGAAMNKCGDENDGVQRMFDYIKDATQTPQERAYAAADAYADSAIHFAALVRKEKAGPDDVLAGAKHLLAQTLAASDIVIGESIKHGHRSVKPHDAE